MNIVKHEIKNYSGWDLWQMTGRKRLVSLKMVIKIENICELWEGIKWPHMHVIGTSRVEETVWTAEKYFKAYLLKVFKFQGVHKPTDQESQ